MDLRVLGNVHLGTDDRIVELGRSAERCVLATLAFSPGRPVPTDTLMENVWGDRHPSRADETIANYVRAVRRAVAEAGGNRDWVVNHRPRAYELRIAPALVDYHRFTAHLGNGRARVRDGEPREAVVAYRQALDLWRADPLANVQGDWADRVRHRLRQERLETLCSLFEQQLLVGEHSAVATEAAEAFNEFVPTDRLIALALRGLAGCGQASLIPGFVDRAAEQMWKSVRMRPGPEVVALARRLIARSATDAPKVPIRVPRPPAGEGQPAVDAESAEGESGGSTAEPDVVEGSTGDANTTSRGGGIVMTAMFNGTVFQAAGDQHITAAPPPDAP